MASVRKQNCIGESNFRPLSAFSFFSHFFLLLLLLLLLQVYAAVAQIWSWTSVTVPHPPIPSLLYHADKQKAQVQRQLFTDHQKPEWFGPSDIITESFSYTIRVAGYYTSQKWSKKRHVSTIKTEKEHDFKRWCHPQTGTGSFQHCCRMNCRWIHEGKRKTNRAF